MSGCGDGRGVVPGREDVVLPVAPALELLARQHHAAVLQGLVVWEAAVWMHRSGVPVEQVAPAVGMSVRSFYRKMSARPK